MSGGVRLRAWDGQALALPAERWVAPASTCDRRVLERSDGPVLDIGCGPGRHVVALAEAGIVAMGIDVSPPALDLARRQGAPVLHRSIFERIPAAGRWGTALLIDGNAGIGADVPVLLRRVSTLLRPAGRVLVEAAPPGSYSWIQTVCFESATGRGPWFSWEHVSIDDIASAAGAAGFTVREVWQDSGRWFAWLNR